VTAPQARIVDGEVRGRIGDNANTFITADIPIIARNAGPTDRARPRRAARKRVWVVVRWSVDGAITVRDDRALSHGQRRQ
jgi:hypothetical protein